MPTIDLTRDLSILATILSTIIHSQSSAVHTPHGKKATKCLPKLNSPELVTFLNVETKYLTVNLKVKGQKTYFSSGS